MEQNQHTKIMAFPGEPQGIIVVPHYVGDKSHLNAHGPEGAPGNYTVVFLLVKPNTRSSPENEVKFTDSFQGDSHIAIAKPAVVIDIDPTEIQVSYRGASSNFVFHGYPNESGFLGKFVSDPFFATNRKTAEKLASTAMQGLLSNLSAQLDIPLIVEFVEVTELATQAKSITFVARFPLVPMSIRGSGTLADPEFEHAIALYREALNTNTPVYRFLCLYKILELSRKRRKRSDKKQRSLVKQDRPGEQIPLENKAEMERWLNSLFYANRDWDDGIYLQIFIPESQGKKINFLIDQFLRPIRDRIAHGILDSGEFMLLDNADNLQMIVKWLPLMRCIARRLMKNDFKEYLEFLNEDGTISTISN